MERNIIFLFALLATLSIINAIPHQLHKRTTSFGPCPPMPPPSPLSVELVPDPIIAGNPTTFVVSGKIRKDVPSNSVLSVEFIDGNGDLIIPKSNADFCSSKGIKCPIQAGTPIRTALDFSVPNDLPASYEIRVSIAESSDSDPNDYLGCALSAVGFTQF